ncbi:MAG: transglycosylase domain-containing protein [Candidatus Peribacteraceae bacterium]|nr:transglycosylase domain-containing protein [Candidatus Peribacteraceae bacterium]
MTPPSFRTRSLGNSPKKRSAKSVNVLPFLSKIIRPFRSIHLRKTYSLRSRFTITRVVLGGAALVVAYIAFLWFTLPDISDPTQLLASQSTVITDRNGVELYRLFNEEDRTFIPGESIPLHMKQAVISIEDERYYDRGCLDLRAVARAVVKLGRAGGGSTITRQLARNALNLQQDNRYQRKIKEFILGCQLEGRYEKEELLELYLNWIPFGRNAYGVEQAAKQYFNTSADKLTIGQAAILASLPQRPSYFSPYGRHVHTEVSDSVHEDVINREIVKVTDIPEEEIIIGLLGSYAGTGSVLLYVGGRTDQVLRNMQEQGYITEAERLASLEDFEDIEFTTSRENIRAPHFVLWVREQIEEMFSGTSEDGLLEQGGLRIETTLDWEMQERAEDSVERHREDLTLRYGGENMALVAIEPESNEIVAYVGNMDYNDTENGGKIDMVQAPRQPGSSFKPFVYASAFQKGYNPATPIYDVATKIGDDEPQNFDGKFMGHMTMREALGASRNVPAAKAFFLGGQENQILTLVSSLGAPTPLERKEELQIERGEFDYGWPLALGAAETPLLEMANAYGSFARGGTKKPLISIRRITDKKGNLLYKAPDEKGKEIIDERIAYQITSILSDESVRPEEYWKTQLTVPGFKTAAKTGTSNKCLEWKEIPIEDKPGEKRKVCLLRKPDNAWLIGYTPNLVAGVWVGNANSASMYDKAGGLNTASPIWRDFMASVHRKIENPKTTFEKPEGIITPQISTLSGQFPTDCTPVTHRRADVFLKERAPSKHDPACKKLTIDKVTKLLASDECPLDAQEEGEFLVAHSLLPERWPTWEEGVVEWVDAQMEMWYAAPDHSGAIIPLPIAPTEDCTLELTPGRLDKPTLNIIAPAPNGSATYPTFKPKIKYDSKAKVLEVLYMIDGKQITTVTEPPFTQTLRVPRSVPESGRHNFSVTLTDEYYNKATARVNFSFEEDERAPQVRFTLPLGDIRLPKGGELKMAADADDQEGGLKYVQFYLGDTLLTTKPKEPFEMTYTITESPGVYQLKVKAIDMSGNSSEDVRTLTID